MREVGSLLSPHLFIVFLSVLYNSLSVPEDSLQYFRAQVAEYCTGWITRDRSWEPQVTAPGVSSHEKRLPRCPPEFERVASHAATKLIRWPTFNFASSLAFRSVASFLSGLCILFFSKQYQSTLVHSKWKDCVHQDDWSGRHWTDNLYENRALGARTLCALLAAIVFFQNLRVPRGHETETTLSMNLWQQTKWGEVTNVHLKHKTWT